MSAEAIERARVVDVLDAWAFCRPGHAFHTELDSSGLWVCQARNVSEIYSGSTPDAARAAAAKAIESGAA